MIHPPCYLVTCHHLYFPEHEFQAQFRGQRLAATSTDVAALSITFKTMNGGLNRDCDIGTTTMTSNSVRADCNFR